LIPAVAAILSSDNADRVDRDMIEIVPETPARGPAIESLLDDAFGPGRRGKAVYRLRDGVAPVDSLCRVALVDGTLRAVIRYWPAALRTAEGLTMPILVLGPIAVDAAWQGKGVGRALVEHTLERAAGLGYRLVVLVGDPGYYARYGFTRSDAEGLFLPGEADQGRLLAREIVPGAAAGATGTIVSIAGGETVDRGEGG
jgi:predicted N-acetyltransferase YhbS